MSVHPPICPSVSLSNSHSVCPSIHLCSVCVSACLTVCPLSIRRSVCLSVCLSVCGNAILAHAEPQQKSIYPNNIHKNDTQRNGATYQSSMVILKLRLHDTVQPSVIGLGVVLQRYFIYQLQIVFSCMGVEYEAQICVPSLVIICIREY